MSYEIGLTQMFQSFLAAYPWDVVDEGIDRVLDHMQGELGIAGLSLWCATPPVVQLRRPNVQPRFFRTRGGLFFQPSSELYSDTRIKPAVSHWVGKRNVIEQIAKGCADRGLTFRCMMSLSRIGRLAHRHPETACKNVFEDSSLTSVCLSNPDVQAFLCDLVGDFGSRIAVDAFYFTDVASLWREGGEGPVKSPGRSGKLASEFLQVCFCESCQQVASGADVDVAGAIDVVKRVIDKRMDGADESEFKFEAIIKEAPALLSYLEAQTHRITELLRRIAERANADVFIMHEQCKEGDSSSQFADSTAIAGDVIRVATADDVKANPSGTKSMQEIHLEGKLLSGASTSELFPLLQRALETGISAVHFGNYGLIPASAFDPIRQALRYARRTTAG